ncbi:MAG: Rne/Rng family ribonuclease [Thermoanaerobaculia bacterium]|nr:Rne/Rng family ribonuclease [Thermoanaerobaculia bacterium]
MQHRLLIQTDPFETRVAVLEDGRLVEAFVERHERRGVVGNIYKGRVSRALAGMQAAFVDVGLGRDAFLYVDDAQPAGAESADDGDLPVIRPIQELVSQGEELLVQVVKDPLPGKGARVTTQIALPGRFLVFLVGTDRVAVSRRIEEPEERERLVELVASLGTPHGFIVRTAGEGRRREDFVEDERYLSGLWEEIEARAERSVAPSLVHRDLHPALRVVRDLVGPSFEEIRVQGGEVFRELAGFVDRVQPSLAERVYEHRGEESLFDAHDLEPQLDAALRRKVWLDSGGYLVIDPTEALVAIDVNTGRFTGGRNLEETVFKTNLEAARELVRQIRLRDLGGIIVVDFIDMERTEHGERVLEELRRELERDRARSKALALSDFGLVEITRKRSRANLMRVLTEPCSDCGGYGRVKTTTTTCLALRREILRSKHRFVGVDVLVIVHPAVETALEGPESRVVQDVEQELGRRLDIRSDPSLERDEFEVVPV